MIRDQSSRVCVCVCITETVACLCVGVTQGYSPYQVARGGEDWLRRDLVTLWHAKYVAGNKLKIYLPTLKEGVFACRPGYERRLQKIKSPATAAAVKQFAGASVCV